MHELALELGMTVQELATGRPGATAHEVSVAWPLFFQYRERRAKAEANKAKGRRG